VPIGHHPAEACEQTIRFGRLTGEQCDLLRILAHPYQIEAEVGLVALLIEIELYQWPADPMRERRAQDRIDERGPDEITGDRKCRSEHVQGRGGGKRPQDHDEGGKRHDCAEEPDADGQRALDEESNVLGDALVGIVCGIAQ
jgi:hypothetical protein